MANISHKSKSGTVTLKLRRFYFNRTCLPDLDFRFLLLILQVKNKTQTNIIMEKTTVIRRIGLVAHDAKNILVLRNAFEKTRKQMKVNALIINALSDNLNFPMFAELTLKKT